MSDFKLIPIAGTKNRVYVELPPKKEKVSLGGIILAGQEEKRPTEGTVIAVSEKDDLGMLPNVKVGDTVFFAEHVGQEAEFEGRNYLVMRENDIQAKLK